MLDSRFWNKVDKLGPTCIRLGSRCWVWTACKNEKGYGILNVSGRPTRAHRLSYEDATGQSLGLLQVDHQCLNKSCVNPAHLRAATNKQNHENLSGARSDNHSSGVRGVTWNARRGRWAAQIKHLGKQINVGLYDTVAAAESAVITRRKELFTHNDLDRINA